MKHTTLAVTLAALLTLTACGNGEEAPSRSDELADLDFPDVDALSAYVADHHNGEATLTEDGKLAGEVLVMIESKGFELSDKGETVKVIQEVGNGVSFDYKWLTVASNTGHGNWGYRYDSDTVDRFTENEPLVDKIWDSAEDGVNTAY